jgi:hypothetical protein
VGPRLTKSEYEGVVLATLREYLIEQDLVFATTGSSQLKVFVWSPPGPHTCWILFRDDARPRCLFGWHLPATEKDADTLEGVEHPAGGRRAFAAGSRPRDGGLDRPDELCGGDRAARLRASIRV